MGDLFGMPGVDPPFALFANEGNARGICAWILLLFCKQGNELLQH